MNQQHASALTDNKLRVEQPAYMQLWSILLSNHTLAQTLLRRSLAAKCGLSVAQFDLLATLMKKPQGMTMGELSEHLLVSNANVTGLVNRLEKEDFVERWPLPADRRVYYVGITAKGLERYQQAAEVHAECLRALTLNFDSPKLQNLIELLTALRQNIEAYKAE